MHPSHLRALLRAVIVSAVAALVVASVPAFAQGKPATASKGKGAAFDASTCLACHAPIKALHDMGKHSNVGCDACHDGTAAHLTDSAKRPVTRTDLATCGGCHQNQYKSYAQMDWRRTARFEKKQMTGPAPDPAYDLLMTPHGFTKEHNLPRGHTFALLDQYVVDRAFGGRFGTKESWRYLAGSGDFKVWDVAVDLYPDNTEQKPFKPGTAAAANPVCLSCKTQDHILEWAYMGDPAPACQVEPDFQGGRAREVREPCAQLHLLPRPARRQTAHRPRRDDRRGDAHRCADSLFAGSAQDQGGGQGNGPARIHAQDRPARTLRRQAAVRTMPRRVQLQPRVQSQYGRADHDGRPPDQLLSRTSTSTTS